jgi:hypothetical protein
MALFSMKPIYKKWLNSMSSLDIEQKIDNLMKEIQNVNKEILEGNISNKDVDLNIKNITRKSLYINLEYNSNKISNPTKDWSKVDNKINIVNDNMKSITSYENDIILKTQKNGIDIISMVSLFFLPLTFIAGYYGMNFKSMGLLDKDTKGPFSYKYGQLFVWILILISIIFCFVFKLIYFG